jgi:peptidoglycan/xylan/chitin deacetylase (PgdA/CDA1 family)
MLAEHHGRWPAALDVAIQSLESELSFRTAQRPLVYAELDRLARDPLVDLGVHTVSHPVLPLLSDDAIRSEIRASYDELRSRYPRIVPLLSFPFGLYDERSVRIGLEEGLSSCLTLGATQLGDGTSSDTIPRICVTEGHRPWKTALYALGWWQGIRAPLQGGHRYPSLPSPTT